MLNRPQRVAAIHDLSGFGRCSISVILPILSVMGIQVCPIPTAVLSSHTGGLGDVVYRDLTDYTVPALQHYQKLGIDFECIYSGFLSSVEQIDHCLQVLQTYRHALKVVDPVMGDHGVAYRTYTKDMQNHMETLVKKADIITPNVTEACILLKKEYINTPLTRLEIKSLLARLGELGPNYTVITGVTMATNEIANVGYDKKHNTYWYAPCEYVPASYPGTGDIFASVLTGSFLNGDSLPIAMGRATQFLEVVIKTTYSYASDTRYGVMLEKELSWLNEKHQIQTYKTL